MKTYAQCTKSLWRTLTFSTDASCEATQDEVVVVHVSAHHITHIYIYTYTVLIGCFLSDINEEAITTVGQQHILL